MHFDFIKYELIIYGAIAITFNYNQKQGEYIKNRPLASYSGKLMLRCGNVIRTHEIK